MTTLDTDGRLGRPDLIVPDTGPLIHLAQSQALHLLHLVGGRVVVPDMVAVEATADPAKPGAQAIQDWLDHGAMPGSNAPIEIEETSIGLAYKAARLGDPDFRWRGAGELAIVDWLTNRADQGEHDVVVLYENGKVPRMIANAGIDGNVDILTTRAFLDLAERRNLVASADVYWQRIVQAAPTANPENVATSHRNPPGSPRR